MKQIESLENVDEPYIYGDHLVWCARIYAVLGEKAQAYQYMKNAFNQGLMFRIGYLYNIDFESLWDYTPWINLMKPKG